MSSHAYLAGPAGLIEDGARIALRFPECSERRVFRITGVCLPTAERPKGQVRVQDELFDKPWIMNAEVLGMRVIEVHSADAGADPSTGATRRMEQESTGGLPTNGARNGLTLVRGGLVS